MKIETRDFGPIETPEESIYDFPKGIYGFESETQFALFTRQIDDVPLMYLQSTQGTSPCFFVFEPWDVLPDFTPILSDEDLKAAEASSADDLVFLSIATIPESIKNMTFNIKSPIILNPKTGKGMQVILQNTDYTVRYQPFLKEGV